MKLTKIFLKWPRYFFLLIVIPCVLYQCSTKAKLSNPNSFKRIINMYSGHNLSTSSPIVIQFVDDVVSKPGSKKYAKAFEINPDVDGEFVWDKRNRLKFVPVNQLEQDSRYQVKVHLDKLFRSVPDSLKTFVFEVTTRKQEFEFGGTFLKPIQDSLYRLHSSIVCSDNISKNQLHEMIKVHVQGKYQTIKWTNVNRNTYHFMIDSLQRKIDPQELVMALYGSPKKRKLIKEQKITLHALGDFKLVEAQVSQDEGQEIRLRFSDFLKSGQDLEGLIYTDKGSFETQVTDHQIILNFKEQISGEVQVGIDRNIMSEKGYKLQEKTIRTLDFQALKPAVKVVDDRTIIPYGNTLPFVFKSVNLQAVDIKVTKIYQKNIPQFLQRSDLDESYGLRYVGETVLKKKIKLKKQTRSGLWQKQYIDLKSLIKTDPGAIYHIDLGFRRSYSTYPCDKLINENYDPSTIGIKKDEVLTERNFWSVKDRQQSYDWEERDNPCHPTYYSNGNYEENRKISTNVLGSDLGLIAKSGKHGELRVAINSIQSTQPLSGVQVKVLNLTNRELSSAKTNDQGFAILGKVEDPFLVVAQWGQQRGYLKLQHAEALSLSKFDVDGTSSSQDLKGFLYAERGVWRPGDSIFINLIVEDAFNNLPEDYPIGFELINPLGQKIERRTTSKGLNGHYRFWTKTKLDDVTGDYLVKAYVGNSTFTKTIKIESIRPNRLKMDWAINNGKPLHCDSLITTEIQTNWLHGAIGAQLRHQIDVTYSHQSPVIKGHNGFQFVAPYREFVMAEEVFLNKNSDKNGNVKVSKRMPTYALAPGFLKANFKLKVFEKGGRFSIDEHSTTYYPHAAYVGIKSKSHREYGPLSRPMYFQLANVDPLGIPKADQLIVRLYKLDYNWWYELNKNNQYKYKGAINKQTVRSDTIDYKSGKIDYKLLLNDGFKEGRYLLTICNSAGHMTGKTIYFYQHEYHEVVSESSGTKDLKLKTNKSSYTVGEEIQLTIPTPVSGRLLISLEDGKKVLKTSWITANKGNTTYRFVASRKMSTYLYANVVFIQPYRHKENDLPLRTYGVIPIRIENKHSRLSPEILCRETIRPKEEFTVKVREKSNKPMTYTLAIVDEGLLDITRYKMPNIWNAFNQKPALEVKTWDVFDRIKEAQKFNVRNLLSLGGDGYEEDPEGIKLNRFKPVVMFAGPFHIPEGATKTHKFKMPNYVGSVKVMLIAGEKQAYGQAEKKVTVKNPLMVLGTLPRVFGPNEEISLPIDVFAMEDHIKAATVQVKTNDLVQVVGSTSAELKFDKPSDKQVYFKLKTVDKFGIAKVHISAKSGNERTDYTVELAVRPSNSRRTLSFSHMLPTGNTFNQVYSAFGYRGTNRLSIEVSSIPSINLTKRLNYLIHYPYGCVEQTTSSIFPQLYLNHIMDLPASRKREIEQNIQGGIERLYRFQTSNGGLSYWPGGTESNEWGSNYAGHFLIEAKSRGFQVDDKVIDKWIKYQNNVAKSWSNYNGNKLAQAYRLYLLALVNKPNKGAMNRLRLSISQNELPSFYLAAAYQMIGKYEVASSLKNTASLSYTEKYGYTYGSGERNKAIALLCLSELNEDKKAWELTKQLAESLNTNRYMSTQTTAYCLLAICKFSKNDGINGGMQFKSNFANSLINTKKTMWEATKKIEEKRELSVTNTGSKPLFLTITQTGIPIVDTDTLYESKGLRMYVHYQDIEENYVDVNKLNQGEDFVAVVKVANQSGKYQRHISLTQIFPAGWEIRNQRLNNEDYHRNPANFEDIRDDRVNLFFDLRKGQTKLFKVYLNASYLGKYYLPAIEAGGMYNYELRARIPGKWVTVTK